MYDALSPTSLHVFYTSSKLTAVVQCCSTLNTRMARIGAQLSQNMLC